MAQKLTNAADAVAPDSETAREIIEAYDARVARLTRNARRSSVAITAIQFGLPVRVVDQVLEQRDQTIRAQSRGG